jgi:L-asparaginase II
MQKGGAEGVQCGAIRDKGWGYALKCDDGNMAASHVMVASLLLAIADPDANQRAVLEGLATRMIQNVRGFDVGTLTATATVRV